MAIALGALMAFGTVPTPLWPLFAGRDGFGSTMVTVAFAAMVVGAAVGFLLLGHLSDRLGRRRIIVPALLTSALAALLLVTWHGVTGLLVARVVTGIGTGLMASTATAYLSDLYSRAHPKRTGSPRPGLVAAVANLGGLSLGPLVAGALAQWAPAPLTTPFVLFGVVLVALAALVLTGPETVDRQKAGESAARFGLRPGGGAVFAAAAGIGFFAFAVMGFFSSLGAVMVRDELGISAPFIAGLAAFAVFAASAVAQLALARLPAASMLTTGVVLFPAGLALTALSLFHPVLALFLVAAALTGAGAGLLFKVSVGQSVAAALPASRAGVLAVFFAIAYAGMGLPSIGFSLAARQFGLRPSMIGFAAALSLGALIAVRASHRLAARADT
ncbi:MFS transporter [Streptomyces camponoticapitis]|uniref:MFS transporter n=1 Tax=Streptomyces camponoticapitis TaxID=1616125 RepID=UPI001E461676|nr:MFS transporter [Streptomyces camponoticapitis]